MAGKKNKKRAASSVDSAHKKQDQKKNKNPSTESLASRLRRLRGTADSTPLPPVWNKADTAFLSPDDDRFDDCLQTSYTNFSWHEPHELEESLHTNFDNCFQQLEGLYLYDAVQPGGQRVSNTFVRRTLIGAPGSTYRYLGLRLFSHPWSITGEDGDSEKGGDATKSKDTDGAVSLVATSAERLSQMIAYGYSKQHAKALLQMGDLNQILVRKTEKQLADKVKADDLKPVGSCDYSLTLVNRMDPSGEKKDLKRDPMLQQKTSVSWHKDSGLQDFSSIAVYHSLMGDETSHTKPWSVALRVAAPHGKNKKGAEITSTATTPALVVPLASGALYYLLDDFNHQHEHAVLSGARQLRYSSTHRVARGQTWQSIRDSCRTVMAAAAASKQQQPSAKQVRAQQQVWTELEFEWIRQWYLQGKQHAELHAFWREPLQYMEECWTKLYTLTTSLLEKLKTGDKEEEGLYDVLIEAYQERIILREKWEARLIDPLYKTLSPDARPFACPTLELSLHDLKTTLTDLRKWKRRKFAGGSSKTKKEKRKVASNWEAMKTSAASTIDSSKTARKKKKQKR